MKKIRLIFLFFAIQTLHGQVSDNFNFNDTSLKVGSTKNLWDVYFLLGKADLFMQNGQAQLDSLVDFLKNNPKLNIEIGSHTHSRGDKTKNLALTKGRADEVLKYLVNHDIEKTRLKAIGYGQSKPLYTDKQLDEIYTRTRCKETKYGNNRVTIKITGS
ncbi:MAG: OmpA family protein [Bacteroidota bacterium]